MADLIRAHDWSATTLGGIETWDPGLVSALDLLLETRFPMVLTWGPDNLLFFNEAYEPILAGKKDCLGQPFADVFREALNDVGPILAKALEGRSSYFEDFHIPLVRNSVLSSTWWSFSYSPIRSSTGDVGGVLCVVYETTRRLLSDEALRTSEAALRVMTDMAPSLLWRCDPEGRLTWVNQRLQSYFGLDQVGDTFWDDHVNPEDVSTAQAVHQVCVSEGRPFECQQRLRGRDGVERWFIVRCQQIHASTGDLIGWCGSATDIDDWRVAADGLGERDELLRDFYGAEGSLLWVADVDTRTVTPINPDSRLAWAISAEGTTTAWEDWATRVHPDDRALFLAGFERATAGETVQVKFRLSAEAGMARRLQLTAFAISPDSSQNRRIGGMVVEVGQDLNPRIYLVESDPARQNGLHHALSRDGFRVRAFDSAPALERVADDLLPGCVLLAVEGDLSSTLRTAAALKSNRRLPWIAVGNFEHRLSDVVQLMKLGASDVLCDPGADAVAAACRAALALLKPDVESPRPSEGARRRIAELTRREREVLEGLVSGGTNKSIAQALNLSPRTVETHRSHLMDRLGVSTLADLLRLASEAGLTAR